MGPGIPHVVFDATTGSRHYLPALAASSDAVDRVRVADGFSQILLGSVLREQLSSGLKAELAEDVRHVVFHAPGAEEKAFRDLLV